MRSTMQDHPLLVSDILRRGQRIHARSTVVTLGATDHREATFRDVGVGAARLAAALADLGVGRGDVVATMCLNHQAHLEAYLAVPSMGAVLHTVNIRLSPDQLAYVIDHAEDKVLLVDAAFAELFAKVRDRVRAVRHVVVVGDGSAGPLDGEPRYDELVGSVRLDEPRDEWPLLDERDAAAMCYTTGTTGDPKGVVYSHRSTWLHSMVLLATPIVGITERDRVLVIVPMFHANAWGAPYAAFFCGADLVLPGPYVQAEPLARAFAQHRPTLSLGVPTIWNDLLRYAQDHEVDLSSLRAVTAGGSAVPRSLIEAFRTRFGVEMIQGWGMTETSPLAAVALAPKDTPPEEELDWRARTGRVVPGVEVRVVGSDGTVLPADGRSIGEFEVRGPWVTAAYHKDDSGERFHDGWLRTGDMGTLDERGFMQITDRTKDVIKSGGEWISSVELENAVMAHPAVFEAAVVAVPDARYDERPLVCVVPRPGERPSPEELRSFLEDRVPRFWLPERFTYLESIPKTSVGKFDKKLLRARYASGELEVLEIERPPRPTS
jgi:fatty-acyl-CoA synthase